MLKLFHPVHAGIMITGAIAAMISTADSLLILSATELTENVIRKKTSADDTGHSSNMLRRHRVTTAVLAVVALGLSYVSPSDLIFTIVSYVWAGIGCTFSVVVLLTLFWKRYHGRAAIITVVAGMLFTIFWISGGFEQHYRVTPEKTQTLVDRKVIGPEESRNLIALDGEKFVKQSRFESALKEKAGFTGDDGRLQVISSAFMHKGVPARLTTFFFSLLAAVIATFLVKPAPKPASLP